MKKLLSIFLAVTVGFILCLLAIYANLIPNLNTDTKTTVSTSAQEESEPTPLYWVAPMDPNFRRDEPGLSPMGMELIPFYGDATNNENEEGVVLLTPEVSNNISVKIEHVAFKPWTHQIQSFGTFTYNEESIHHLHSRVSGWIDELYVKSQGQQVKKGQPLYSFYSPELANAQEELILSLRTKEPQLIQAAKAKLIALGVPAETVSIIETSRKVLKNITYYAAHDGVVKKLMVRHGFYVKPESNIMSIAPLDNIWLIAEVFESQLRYIQPEMSVSIKSEAYPHSEIFGSVDYIYPSLQLPSRTAKIRVRVDNTNLLLKPNMFAQVTFTQHDEYNTVIVPQSAVIRTGSSDRVVLVLNDGSYQSIPVQIGRADQKYIEITAGLEEGDCVVSSAQFLIDSESSFGREFSRMNAEHHPAPNMTHDMSHDMTHDMSHEMTNEVEMPSHHDH